MTPRWSSVGLALGALVLAACSSRAAPGSPGGGGQAGEGGAGGAKGWTIDDYCARFGPRWCEALRPCCEETSGVPYDAAGCLARWTTEVCEPLVQAVNDGRVAFALGVYSEDAAEAEIDDCIAQWSAHFAKCQSATLYDFFDWLVTLNRRCNAFVGLAEDNAPCQEDADCAKTFTNAWVACAGLPGENTCESFPAATSLVCAHGAYPCLPGTYCDAPLIEGELGVCVPATPVGMPCAPDPLNPECGIGHHCDLATGTCVASTGGLGEACVTSADGYLYNYNSCQSSACFNGTCSHPLLWPEAYPSRFASVDPWTCAGEEGL